MESALPLNLTAVGVCENLVIEGQPLTVELGLLAGSSTTDLSIPMSAYPHGHGCGRSDLGWAWSVVLASTGQSVDPGEALSIQTTFEEVDVTGAFGKFFRIVASHRSADGHARADQLGSGAVLPQCTPFGF